MMDAFDIMMVALKFNVKINQRDLDGIVELMTDDHTFIDGEGEVHRGREVMNQGWRDFFASYPDYRNIFTRVQVVNDLVVMVGYSTCSYEPLGGPALWSAKVREGHGSEWRVYADTSQNRKEIGITA
ncbi:MAG: nuclear transport factor 2 family protein [Candidatus Bathyarchaeota archaeon]|nr:MAG: nuclear transport factor 2 family protein [Candidatus Bathyarchaeota archaeon]